MGVQSGRVGVIRIPATQSVPNNATQGTPDFRGGIAIADYHWIGIRLPAGWTTAAVALEFTDIAVGSITTADADWWAWREDGADIIDTGATGGRYIAFNRMLPFFGAATRMRICSGPRGARVAQASQMDLDVFMRNFH